MKQFLSEVIEGFFFLVMLIFILPIMFILFVIESIKKIANYISNLYLSNKKYNENKIKKKLYKRIQSILNKQKEIHINKAFWIPKDDYDRYITLKYLFTNNKETFKYNKSCDKYLYNYYDYNAYQDGFIEKWIEEIKLMFLSNNAVEVKDIVEKDEKDEKYILKIKEKEKDIL